MKTQRPGFFLFGIPAVLLVCLSLLLNSCYYDNEEDLYPQQPCDTTDYKYSTVIQPILSERCYQCHNNATAPSMGNGVSFEGHANLTQYLSFGEQFFLGAITHLPGYPQMPFGGAKIPDCEIQKIELWIAAGKPNN